MKLEDVAHTNPIPTCGLIRDCDLVKPVGIGQATRAGAHSIQHSIEPVTRAGKQHNRIPIPNGRQVQTGRCVQELGEERETRRIV
ncbi:MAG: hypothetical protein E6G60_16145 [Actinobacteria bacterium]|nr:MAG: hypothetical protein E6G60_16145 [Actinomycetota bacterium]